MLGKIYLKTKILRILNVSLRAFFIISVGILLLLGSKVAFANINDNYEKKIIEENTEIVQYTETNVIFAYGSKGSTPGQGGTKPPGHGGTPPGQGGTSPGQTKK